MSLAFPVGKGGKNQYKDVSVVQTLLNNCLYLLVPLRARSVDGKIGPVTVALIEEFQRRADLIDPSLVMDKAKCQ